MQITYKNEEYYLIKKFEIDSMVVYKFSSLNNHIYLDEDLKLITNTDILSKIANKLKVHTDVKIGGF